jgi:flagellar basal body-associated protein FliL
LLFDCYVVRYQKEINEEREKRIGVTVTFMIIIIIIIIIIIMMMMMMIITLTLTYLLTHLPNYLTMLGKETLSEKHD